MMRRMVAVATVVSLATVAGRAAIVVTDFKGSPNVPGTAVLSFNASTVARELWCTWDGTDKGAAFADWSSNERVGTVAAHTTSLTAVLPEGAKGASVACFFLLPVGGSYAVDYIRSTGKSCIDTEFKPTPTTAVSAEAEPLDLYTTQQRLFGTASDTALTVVSYFSGGRVWSWSFNDNVGNWAWTQNPPCPLRTRMTLDGLKGYMELTFGGVVVASNNMPTVRTQTASTSLVLLGTPVVSGGYVQFMKALFYGATIDDNGSRVADYRPYVQNGVAGVRNSVDGSFRASATDVPFIPGGRTDCPSAGVETGTTLYLSSLRRGDVWSDAAYIWDFTRADRNDDGQVAADEIRNALQHGTGEDKTAVVCSSASVSGANGKGVTWGRGSVSMPSRGFALEDSTYLDIPAVYKIENGATNAWRNGIRIENATIPGSVTVVARLMVRNFAYNGFVNSPSWFLNNGLDWGACRGVQFGFNPTNDGGTNAVPRFLQGQTFVTSASGPTLQTNTWYDVAYSLHDNGDQTGTWMMAVSETHSGEKGVWVDAGTFSHVFTNELARGASRITIGGEEAGNGWLAVRGGSNGGKGFNGCIQRIAMWPRALSRDEIAEAFVQAAPLVRVGTENGSSGEFGSIEEAADTFDAEQEPWSRFCGTLSAAHPLATITTKMRDGSRTVPYVLCVRGVSGTAAVEAFIDGVSLGQRAFTTGAAKSWFVPVKVLARKTGDVTVELRWRSGGTLTLDTVELSGSAMLGIANGNSSDFSQEGTTEKQSYAGQWNWKRYARAVLSNNRHATTEVNFWVPPELAAKNAFRYTSRVCDQGGDANGVLVNDYGFTKNQWPFTMFMNGKAVYETQGMPSQTTFSAMFEKGELKAGWNKLLFLAHAPASAVYWITFDYHRLEVIENPTPTILMFR